jgi:predicted Zn-ribbon and HTH transcriptional regulator
VTRPAVEVADILRAQADKFIERHGDLPIQHLRVIRAITRCRTAALGGHIDVCSRCGYRSISYNSCRNRHCPKCQAQARQRWIAARRRELLSTSYFHVVFTLPHELNTLVRQNQRRLYNVLFHTVAETLMQLAADPKHLGAKIGFFAILHTWGQNLLFHPHIHCVVPAGGIAPDRSRWIRPRYPFFLPVKALSKVFRGKFVHRLRRAFREKRLTFAGEIQCLEDPKSFAAFLRKLFQQHWVVYAKPTFGGPQQVLRYLGRYTHRVAISNHRLLAFDGDQVRFRWKDYARGNKQRQMTVSADEFIRRFLLHVLPPGFVRIRHYGFFANSQRTDSHELCRKLLTMPHLETAEETNSASVSSWFCPRCHGLMTVVKRLTALEIRWPILLQWTFFDTS